ncbi:MAG: MFS transporter [Candidatus Accumulibacter sp.]|uniref:MFS transporter n=1 Tax=Accumulibacter sp. TaxID=2053492 RepID=UPI001A011AB5|nr:MFS transporter [Accumulibacter sp.]MBE2260602.1 MFS transporter [Paracoccaceae bacterium]MCB1942557.1 MFS transporter [Accumulibacter sp.]MCP5249996.1 MFS transporter [Accumulibacter sp.]
MAPAFTLPRRQLLAHGALGLPLAMAALPVYVHVPRLYAEAAGMSLSLLGALLLTGRLLDAGMDPLLGGWSDRTANRQRLILLALPCLALGMFALLQPPATAAASWLLVSMLITYFGFSLATVAYQAWGAELGRDAGERTRLTASREGFGLLGVVLAAALPGLISADLARGLAGLAQLFPLLLLLLAAWTLSGSPRSVARTPASGSLLGDLRGVFADHRFRRLLAVFVVNGVAAALPATLVLFYVADVLQAETWSGPFLALYFVSGVAFLPLWVVLARRVGRVRSWIASMLVAVASFAWAWGLGAGDVWPFAVVCLLSGAALGADLTLPAALLADLSEHRRSADGAGSRPAQAGAYFGWWNLVGKLNLALAAGLSLPLLDLVGYQPGVAGTASGLAAIYCLLPLLFKTLAGLLAWRWRGTLEGW